MTAREREVLRLWALLQPMEVRGLINATQLEEALNEQRTSGRFFGEILVARGISSEEQIAKALSAQLGFAFVDLKEISIEPKALELVSREVCDK